MLSYSSFSKKAIFRTWRGKVIQGEFFSEACDYTLGDQSGNHNFCVNHHYEEANDKNRNFMSYLNFVNENHVGNPVISIFIDTVRLAGLLPRKFRTEDKIYLENLVQSNNLFSIISRYPRIRFVIFCGLEDTELDDRIDKLIPSNVIGIHATHALSDHHLVEPLPNGVQREMALGEGYHVYLENLIKRSRKESSIKSIMSGKSKLIYVNVNVGTNPRRAEVRDFFRKKTWAKVEMRRLSRKRYLKELMNYPFILCPPGRSVGDTHREWESLYLGSVPVVEDTKYLRKLYSGYPVLFVRDFKEVDSALLLDNLHLVSALRQKSLHEFDARRIYAERIMSSLSRS